MSESGHNGPVLGFSPASFQGNLVQPAADSPQIPPEDELLKRLQSVNYNKISLENKSVRFLLPEMKLDLGGVAKGYIVDQGIEVLKMMGIGSAIIEAGGDLRMIGVHPKRKHWKIGIRHPRVEDISLIGVVTSNGRHGRLKVNEENQLTLKDNESILRLVPLIS